MSLVRRKVPLGIFNGEPVDSLIAALNKSKEDVTRPVVEWEGGAELEVVGMYQGENDPKRVAGIHTRYFRKVMAHPVGAIVHDGDCNFFSRDICTCGLLHELTWLCEPVKVFAEYWQQLAEQDRVFEKISGDDDRQLKALENIFEYSELVRTSRLIKEALELASNEGRSPKLTPEETATFFSAVDGISE